MLMALVQHRDEAAFGRLIDRHLVGLRAFLVRFGGNVADAEEVAQETFLRIWREAMRWQSGRVQFSTWLYRIGRNLAIDRLRRRREFTTDVLPEVEDDADPEISTSREQLRARVAAAITSLPERQRTALLLSHYQGLSNPETAQVLETSVDAVESLLARARRSLKQTLKAEIDSLGGLS